MMTLTAQFLTWSRFLNYCSFDDDFCTIADYDDALCIITNYDDAFCSVADYDDVLCTATNYANALCAMADLRWRSLLVPASSQQSQRHSASPGTNDPSRASLRASSRHSHIVPSRFTIPQVPLARLTRPALVQGVNVVIVSSTEVLQRGVGIKGQAWIFHIDTPKSFAPQNAWRFD